MLLDTQQCLTSILLNFFFDYIAVGNYINFIKESFRKNKPYDKFVHELLTSQGKLHNADNGATGYYLRDAGMPLMDS